jgi:acyl-coenzyme A synthetase/AMP-(fatty) acid ligase
MRIYQPWNTILVGNSTSFPNVQPFEDLLQQFPENIKFPKINNHAVATILYTSGTTARPKGVTHTHYSLQRTGVYHAQQVGLNSADISGVMLPLCHIFGFALQLVAAVSVGATLVIMPHFEPALVLQNLDRHGVTKLYGLPVMYNALVNYSDVADYQLNYLQVCFAGGDAVPPNPAVREVGVIGVPDRTWGEIVQAFVVLQSGYSITKAELIEFMRPRIATYKIPEAIAFLPELPKGLTGKIHRKILRDWTTATFTASSLA